MGRKNVQFVEISPYGDEYVRMQQFAQSFGHRIEVARNERLYAFQRGDRVFGYSEVVHLPVAFPAFCPALTDARDVVEILDGWRHHCEISTGGEGFIATPLPEDRGTFPIEMIENAGFARMKREIYAVRERK